MRVIFWGARKAGTLSSLGCSCCIYGIMYCSESNIYNISYTRCLPYGEKGQEIGVL